MAELRKDVNKVFQIFQNNVANVLQTLMDYFRTSNATKLPIKTPTPIFGTWVHETTTAVKATIHELTIHLSSKYFQ